MHFGGIHAVAVFARLINHAFAVAQGNVFAFQPQRHQQIGAGNRRRARARNHKAHVFQFFAHHAQAVDGGGGGDNRRAVLVVVEHGDVAALFQFLLNIKAFGRFDVFQIDAAEGGFQRGDDVHQLVGVLLVDFNVKHINAREFFEQHALAFHHGLARLRADVAQAQHRRAVGNHRHQIAFGGVFVGIGRVGVDFHARRGNAGGIRQRQILLRCQ